MNLAKQPLFVAKQTFPPYRYMSRKLDAFNMARKETHLVNKGHELTQMNKKFLTTKELELIHVNCSI
jgi:hypothetical protein